VPQIHDLLSCGNGSRIAASFSSSRYRQIAGPQSGTHRALLHTMVSRRSARVGCGHKQLALALGEVHEPAAPVVTRARMQRRSSPAGTLAAHLDVTQGLRPARTLPARDGRGRFVAYPTTNAPSWYVFCCDSYRIVDERPEALVPPAAPRALPTLAHAIAQPRRWRCTRTDAQNGLAFLLLVLVLTWYWWQLPPPHH
jgi:hypothetical protein